MQSRFSYRKRHWTELDSIWCHRLWIRTGDRQGKPPPWTHHDSQRLLRPQLLYHFHQPPCELRAWCHPYLVASRWTRPKNRHFCQEDDWCQAFGRSIPNTYRKGLPFQVKRFSSTTKSQSKLHIPWTYLFHKVRFFERHFRKPDIDIVFI